MARISRALIHKLPCTSMDEISIYGDEEDDSDFACYNSSFQIDEENIITHML